MDRRLRAIDIGLYDATRPEGAERAGGAAGDGPRTLVVRTSDDRVGVVTLHVDEPAADTSRVDDPSWTRYEIRAGTQKVSLDDVGAIVFAEEYGLQAGVTPADYERWVDSAWGPGVTDLDGYDAAFFIRGIAGARTGGYGSIGFFPSVEVRERLLAGLTDTYPPELEGYVALIGEAFGRYLDRDNRHFMRMDVVSDGPATDWAVT